MRSRLTLVASIVLALLAAPFAVESQPAKVARIGFLSASSLADPRTQTFVDAFRQSLRDLGWVEGQNVVIEYRWAEDKTERLPELAADLAQRKVDILLAATTPAIRAAKEATGTIPIVMANAGEAVGSGFVTSLARPGGNITGLSMLAGELVAKQLQILKEVVPKVSRVALLWNPANPSNPVQRAHAEDAARAAGVRLEPLEVRGPADVDRAFATMTKERAGGIIVLVDSLLISQRTRIADLATKHRLPTIYGLIDHVRAGGLVAYGPNIPDLYRRAAIYVDKILKGAKPGDLPIEQPTKFELVVNLKTAKALGLTIPPSLLLRADQVIE